MKRKIMLSCVLLITVSSLFTACSFKKEDEEPTEVIEDSSEKISVTIENDKSIMEMTREELKALTAEEVKSIVEEQLPNYREIYIIDEDKVMEDADWLQLRDIIILQLFGPEEIPDLNIDTSEIPEAETDPNAIYYAPTKEYLDGLSTEEFAQYLNGMYAYLNNGITDSEVDFSQMDETTLLEQKKALYETLGFDIE